MIDVTFLKEDRIGHGQQPADAIQYKSIKQSHKQFPLLLDESSLLGCIPETGTEYRWEHRVVRDRRTG
ncbi:MAG: hypothetical protein CBB92_04070 [Flammeovirgaceae bacterium TMED32]|nr:MAG: hypothetical protein CBB92_04070 [Flammeovirgaceae bacterium TMED32]